MADIVPLGKKKRKDRQRIVAVTWGSQGSIHIDEMVVKRQSDIDLKTEPDMLYITGDDGVMHCYPLPAIFKWTERDHPEDEDIA